MGQSSIKMFVKQLLRLMGGRKIKGLFNSLHPIKGKNNKVLVHGNVLGLKKSIIGNDNVVDIKDSIIRDCSIRIRGNRNKLLIEEGCNIGKGCSFWLEGNNNAIIIGRNTTMTLRCHFNAQEQNTKIIVGDDCMFSNTIIVRTSDSHPIYNEEGSRINPANDIIIGNHVWIAPSSVIMKGAEIGNGCVVGSHSMVNKSFPENSLIVGMPAHIAKEKIRWTRENIIN